MRPRSSAPASCSSEIVRAAVARARVDEERAIQALARDQERGDRRRVLDGLDHLLSLRPALTEDQQERLRSVTSLLHTVTSKRAQRERAMAGDWIMRRRTPRAGPSGRNTVTPSRSRPVATTMAGVGMRPTRRIRRATLDRYPKKAD